VFKNTDNDFTAAVERNVTQYSELKSAVFWDVTLCGSYKNQPFGGTYHLHHESDESAS
jgi:hypothetical protein